MAKKAKAPRITKLLTPHQLMVLMSEVSSLSTPKEHALIEHLFKELDPDTWEHHPRYGRYAMASVESIFGQLVVKCCGYIRREQEVAE